MLFALLESLQCVALFVVKCAPLRAEVFTDRFDVIRKPSYLRLTDRFLSFVVRGMKVNPFGFMAFFNCSNAGSELIVFLTMLLRQFVGSFGADPLTCRLFQFQNVPRCVFRPTGVFATITSGIIEHPFIAEDLPSGFFVCLRVCLLEERLGVFWGWDSLCCLWVSPPACENAGNTVPFVVITVWSFFHSTKIECEHWVLIIWF